MLSAKPPQPTLFPEYQIETGARFSPCEKYRYALWRIWNKQLPALGFLLLNPSTATADKDDPTVHRCGERARLLGYGAVYVANLFAYRSTDPAELYRVPSPVSANGDEDNDRWTHYYMMMCHKVVCGWGKDGVYLGRDRVVLNLFRDYMPPQFLNALHVNDDGTPTHPLYLSYQTKLQPYDGGALCH